MYQKEAAAALPDEVAVKVSYDSRIRILDFLKEHGNLTCNSVDEVDHTRSVHWTCEYFGCDEVAKTFQKISQGGIFVLFTRFHGFRDNKFLRNRTGFTLSGEAFRSLNMENFVAAMQLYLLLKIICVLGFVVEKAAHQGAKLGIYFTQVIVSLYLLHMKRRNTFS